jgi:hypothetical protein
MLGHREGKKPDNFLSGNLLFQRVNLLGQLGFLVCSLLPVNNVLLGEFVDHGGDFLQ